MPIPKCPTCGNVIPADDINVAKDVAYCRACNLAQPLSGLAGNPEPGANVDPRKPPAGAWCRKDGMGTVVGATHRSIVGALGALAFGLFWNGIVSVFVTFAVSATLTHLHIPVPEWFPAPNMNGSPMSLGMTLFLWLFLTPFILIGLVMIGAFFSCLAGRTEVVVQNTECVVFTGIGPIGWRRRFTRSSVRGVRIEDQSWRDSDGDRRRKVAIVIELSEGKRIKFGSSLSEERRVFVAGVLDQVL